MRSIEECAEAALADYDDAFRDRFASDPLRVMTSELMLSVVAAEHLVERRDDGGACDGMSFLKDGVILYAPSHNSRRQYFTLAHELGHLLVERTDEIFDWLAQQPSPEVALESLCDLIAQRLLLPSSLIGRVVGDGPATAQHAIDLEAASTVSLPVAAIALARQLPGLGAVVVCRFDFGSGDQRVQYASVRPDPQRGWPKVYPWPGQIVPAGHPLKSIMKGGARRCKTTWATPWGATSDFYMDAIATDDGRVVAVFADADLWSITRLHLDAERDFDRRMERTVACCGATRVARGFPCQRCGQLACPKCGMCKCQRDDAASVACASCWLVYRPDLLVDGLCENCR